MDQPIRLLLWTVLLGVKFLSASGREYTMRHYTQADGLPGNTIYDIYQDKSGYLWLATNAGVSRYSGLRFENFTTSDGLPDNECFFFREDPYGRLWIATYSGTLVYFKDGVFHTGKNTPLLRLPFEKEALQNIRIEADSSVTFVFYPIRFFLSIKNKERKIFDLGRIVQEPDFTLDAIQNIRNEKGKLKITYKKGSITCNERLQVLERTRFTIPPLSWCFSIPGEEYYFSGNTIYDGTMGVYKKYTHAAILSNRILKVRTYAGITFTATTRGLWIDTERVLSNMIVSNVFKDRDGNYWISTLGNGIYKLGRSFRDIVFDKEVYTGQVTYTYGDKDVNLFGTNTGNIYQLSPAGVKRLVDFRQLTGSVLKGKAGYYVDRKYILVNGAEGSYLLSRQAPSKVLQQLHTDVYGAKILFHSPYLYLCTKRGLTVLPYNRLATAANLSGISPRFTNAGEPDPLLSIAQAPDSSIWVATGNKLYRIADTSRVRQQQFGALSLREFIFTKHALVGYTFDNKLVIAHRYNSPSVQLDYVPENDAVWNKFYPLNDSIVILSANDGFRIITTTPTAYRINRLEHASLPERADHIYSDEKYCYFFKDRSVTGIPLQELIAGSGPPQLHFSGLKTREHTFSVQPAMKLAYDVSRDIRISFDVLSFEAANLRLEYHIATNADTASKWQQLSAGHINLYNISPGTYYIKIRAVTATGVSSNVLQCTLLIGRPFWLSWWFLLLSAASLLLLLYAGVRFFIRKMEKAKKRELKFLKSEFIALNALMNPHFIFNSLNSVQSLISKDDPEAASKYIRTFSDMIRQNMHNLSADRISLEKEMILVANYLELEKLRFKKWLDYEIGIADEVETDLIMIPPLLVQPLVENAIKHGLWSQKVKQGFIHIHIIEQEEVVQVIVRDNGPGFGQADQDHQSLALSNIRSRLQKLSQIHRQRIELEILEERDEQGNVMGVCSRLNIYPE